MTTEIEIIGVSAMSDIEVIRVECEAIRKFCQGNKELAVQISGDLGSQMRNYIDIRSPEAVSSDELCAFIGSATWKN